MTALDAKRAPGSGLRAYCHFASEIAILHLWTGPAEQVLHLNAVAEYNLRDLGPWQVVGDYPPATASVWQSPDPFHPGRVIYWAERSGGIYLNEDNQTIYLLYLIFRTRLQTICCSFCARVHRRP